MNDGENIWLNIVPKAKLTFRIGQCQFWIYESKAHVRFLLMAIVLFNISLTILEILTFEISMTLIF